MENKTLIETPLKNYNQRKRKQQHYFLK